MIDTGSAENYIPEQVLSDTNIDKRRLEKSQIVEVANGSTITVHEYTDLSFSLANDKNVFYKSKFLLLPNPNNIIILGMRFLLENDAILNLKEGLVNLDDIEYDISRKTHTNNQFDTEITNKTKIFAVKDDIKNIIEKAKAKNPTLGNITLLKHHIQLISDFTQKRREYPVPVAIQSEVKEHLENLIKQEVIEERDCEIISPLFIIKKKNGKLRLVVDYRHLLNSITKKVHQITPNIYEILARLKGSRIFFLIDLNQGYYQISIDENDVFKTEFAILNRTFVFKRMS